MKSIRIAFACLLFAISARAADIVTATITFTNTTFATTNGQTLTVNGSVRTWTNSVGNAATDILADGLIGKSTTNLFNHISATPFTGVDMTRSSSNVIALRGAPGLAMTVTIFSNWATLSYSTNTLTNSIVVRVPKSVETPGVRTNVSSGLSSWIEDAGNTNSIDQNSFAVSELVGMTNSQTVSGNKRFTGANYHTNSIFDHGVLTNGVNYGQAFSSPGAGSSSEQFGLGATASGGNSVALGEISAASATGAVALGGDTIASGQASIAVGNEAHSGGAAAIAIGATSVANGTASLAIGETAEADGDGSSAIGFAATTDVYTNSTALGYQATSTADNQVMLGSSSVSVTVNNDLMVGDDATVTDALQVNGSMSGVVGSLTNGTAYNPTIEGGSLRRFTAVGTNLFPQHSDISFARYPITTLANGNNAGVIVGTNLFVEVSGPSGAFTINGMTAGPNRDGKEVEIWNQTGQTMTIAHESGIDATAGNRIRTGYGADITVTNNPGCVTFRYSGAASRWMIKSKTP